MIVSSSLYLWRGQDSNLRPSGYEPDELPAAPPRGVGYKYTHIMPSSQAIKILVLSLNKIAGVVMQGVYG